MKKIVNALKSPSLLIKTLKYKTEYARAYLPGKVNKLLLGKVTFIGVTGSAGKTTCKDIVYELLSCFGTTNKTQATHNDSIGVYWAVKRTRQNHQYCVLEVAGAMPNMLDKSLKFFKPTISIVTNVKNDHKSAFGSISGIAHEKGKLVSALPSSGFAILNIDDPLVWEMSKITKAQIISYGAAKEAIVRLISTKSNWPNTLTIEVEYDRQIYEINTKLHGTQLTYSVLAAFCVAIALKLPLTDALVSIESVPQFEGRMEVLQDINKDIHFVRDDWKAPEWSLPYAFEFIKTAAAKRKIIIVGTVSDSSKSPSQRYPKIARNALEVADQVIFIGQHANKALKARVNVNDNNILAFKEIKEASDFLDQHLLAGDLVLLKGTAIDHLGRLYLNRKKGIHCWLNETQCKLAIMCSQCPKLYEKLANKPSFQPKQLSNSSTPVVIIGLGNPKKELDSTPHNIGFMSVDNLVSSLGGTWKKTSNGYMSTIDLNNKPFIVFKPGTLINNSGQAIYDFFKKNDLNLSRTLIIQDDMDMKFGKIRHKTNGSDGGHQGIRSIITNFQTDDFHRIKIGAREKGNNENLKDTVLRNFDDKQLTSITESLEKAHKLTIKFIESNGQPKDNLMNL